MASRITHLTKEGIGLLLVGTIFLLLLAKYFLPDTLIAGTKTFTDRLTMEGYGLRVKTAVLWDPSLRQASAANTGEKTAEAIPVLVYHGLTSPSDKSVSVSPSTFREHLFALKRAGWQTITLKEFDAFMHNRTSFPEKSFLLTFDDGIRSSWIYADPVLEALNYTAVMFIITEFSTKEKRSPYYLSRSEVETMIHSERWEIQSHGRLAHIPIVIDPNGTKGAFLSNLKWLESEGRLETLEEYQQRIRTDFEESHVEIESLGIPSMAYAFPAGDFGQASLNNLEHAQREILAAIKPVYSLVNFFQFWPSRGYTFNYPAESPNDLLAKRITPDQKWDGTKLVRVLETAQNKHLPYTDTFAEQQGWVSVWGDQVFEHEGVTVSASEKTTGGLSFLDGTRLWDSNRFEAEVVMENGINMSLVGRYRDVTHYVSCSFGTDKIFIQQLMDGIETTVASVPTPTFTYGQPFRPSLEIVNDEMSCGINGTMLVSSSLTPDMIAPTGGVGLKTWDPQLDNSSAHFLSVHVTSIEK